MDEFKKLIREVPDFPKPGILFYDITTLLKDREGFCRLIDYLTLHTRPVHADLVLGIEARGFIFGPALAYNINAGFVPVRKPKKLPGETESVSYDLEYGTDTLEIHTGAIPSGRKGGGRRGRLHVRRRTRLPRRAREACRLPGLLADSIRLLTGGSKSLPPRATRP